MKNWLFFAVSMTAIFLLLSPAASAHHSSSAFDIDHPLTVTGTVTNFEWSNPHAFIYLDVKDKNGQVEKWRVEANSPNMLSRAGWNKDIIRTGDRISVTGGQAKNGTKVMRLATVLLSNGQKLDGQGFSYGH